LLSFDASIASFTKISEQAVTTKTLKLGYKISLTNFQRIIDQASWVVQHVGQAGTDETFHFLIVGMGCMTRVLYSGVKILGGEES